MLWAAITSEGKAPVTCADAIAHATHVCYLPQLIGYHYFINGSSLVQDDVKSGETYQVVVTNQAGLYRFKTNHTLTVLEKTVSEVFITFE